MEAHNNGYYYFLYESTTGSVHAWLTCYVHDHEYMVTRSNDGVQHMSVPTESEQDKFYSWLCDNNIDTLEVGYYTIQ